MKVCFLLTIVNRVQLLNCIRRVKKNRRGQCWMGGQSFGKAFDVLVMSVLNTFCVTCLTDCPPSLTVYSQI